MANRYYSAIAQDTTLASGITNAANSMTVSALVGFPASFPYVVAVDYNAANEELILVTNAVGTTLTITRGFNGSTAVSHSAGAVVRHVIVAQDLTDAQTHYDATTSVHGITDTSTLVTASGSQTLTNKTINASNNTISNLATSMFATSVIDTDGTYTYLLNKDVNFMREAYPVPTSTGLPKHYAYFDDNTFIVGPTPNSSYSAELHYGYYPPSIVTAGTTWLGDEFDSALLNGALIEAIRFMKGEQDMVQLYQTLYVQAVGLLKNLGDGKLRQDAYRSGQFREKVS